MPTIRENIAYIYRRYILPKREIILHLAKAILILFAIALALECFVFNFYYFSTAGLNTINLKNKISLREDSEGYFRLTEANHDLEFNNLNTEVYNLAIIFDREQTPQNLEIKILFTDEAHRRYFDSTEYTEGIPIVNVSTFSEKSQYIKLNTTGYMNSLKISIVGDDVTYPIKLETVLLNAHRPFAFNVLRMLSAFFILLLLYAFRPRSAIYRIRIVESPRASRIAIISAVVIECALISTFLFFGSNLVGVSTANYNYGEWDGSSIVNVHDVGGKNAQQYAELAKSITEGHLYLDEEPPQWLKDMDTPYDKGARDELQKMTGESYLFDVAYFKGHYYVYFGVVPVFLFYLPFYLLTGANFPTAIGVLIAILFFVAGCAALLDRFARYHFKNVSLGLYLLMQIALVTCCGVLYLIKFPTFYSLPLACGLAFSVWGLYFWMCGRSTRSSGNVRRCVCFFAGSLCMALVAGCRPQLLLLSLLAFPLFWRPYITEKRIRTKQGVIEFICLIAPYFIIAAGIMAYNRARFGSFTDFGANYNLTVNDMTKRGWVIGRFAPAFFAYFIQPPNVVGVFPFLQPTDFATSYMGQTIKEATFGGIFACFPLLWIIFFAVPIIRLRNSQRESNTISGVIGVLAFSGVVIAMVDAQMAGILQRYYADFSFMFFAAIVLLVFIINENLNTDLPSKGFFKKTIKSPSFKVLVSRFGVLGAIRKRLDQRKIIKLKKRSFSLYQPGVLPKSIFLKVLIAFVAIGVIYSVLLCFAPETGWYSDTFPWAYQDILENISFWK